MRISNKAILVVLIAWLFFSLMALQGFYGINPDGTTHKKMASDPESSPTYAPLLRSFSWLFVHNETAWAFFIMFLFAVITPLLLYWIAHDWLATWFYFSISSYFYFFLQGAYSQGLLLIFFLGLFASKNNLVRLGIVVLGIASHSTAAYLLPVTFLLIVLNENRAMIKNEFGKLVLGCSGFWGTQSPEILEKPVVITKLSGEPASHWASFVTLNSLFSLFFKIAPLPFLIPALKELWVKRRFDFIILMIVSFVAAFQFETRTWFLIALPTIIGFTWFFRKSKHKRLWFLLSIIFFVFNVYQWIQFSLLCGGV